MKIAVLTSGGVDSSVALALLKSQGHDVTAFYLKIWLEDELAYLGSCPWQEDLSYVTRLCEQLAVPLQVVPLQTEYFEQVVAYAISAVAAGLTPNPDIFCNSRIKFGAFLGAIDPSFTHIASGHYAQLSAASELLMSADVVKDQTYFLAHLTHQQLARLLFPVGHLTKQQVRTLAGDLQLPSYNRPDSQGICFLGKLKFNDFLRHHLSDRPGPIIEYETGKILGEHHGFYFHTIGQRKGLGLSGGPYYVVAKNPALNQLIVSREYYSSDKLRNRFTIEVPHWIVGVPTTQRLTVKLRHGPQMYPCHIVGNEVTIAGRDQGIAPGQFAVFYDQNICLGCAMIMA